MAVVNINAFPGDQEALVFQDRLPLLNQVFSFYYEDESIFDFPAYISPFCYIYDEREGTLIKSFTAQISRNSNNLVFNCSVADMTFDDLGKYYYLMGYQRSGGYEIILRYGNLKVI